MIQPLTTAIHCTVGKAPDFDTLGPWSGIKLLDVFLLVHKLLSQVQIQHVDFFRFIATLFVMRVRRDCMQHVHVRAPKARLYETHPSLHDRAGTLASQV